MDELTYDNSQLTKNDALGCETSLSNNKVHSLTRHELSLNIIIASFIIWLVKISLKPMILTTIQGDRNG